MQIHIAHLLSFTFIRISNFASGRVYHLPHNNLKYEWNIPIDLVHNVFVYGSVLGYGYVQVHFYIGELSINYSRLLILVLLFLHFQKINSS